MVQKYDIKREDEKNLEHSAKPTEQIVRASLKRYIVLLLFCLNTGNKSFQWIQVPASTTKAALFYGVDHYVINFASIIFMLAFILVSWPACYIIQRVGVRKAILFASFGTILGSTVKCFSCYEDGVALLLLGQTIISISEQLVHQIPPRLASLWFPDSQVSTCVSLCVFGNQFGIAVGFLLPQWLLRDAFTQDEIGARLYELFLITLIYSSGLFVANLLLFDEAPVHAPGLARQRQIAIEKESCQSDPASGSVKQLWRQILDCYKNKDLVLISIVFGLSYGRADTIATLLDQTLRPIFPDNPLLVGKVGFIIITAGAVGSPFWGRVMDKRRRYTKFIMVGVAICTALGLLLLAYMQRFLKSEDGVCVAALLIGFFHSGSFVSAMDFAVEVTYPAPEIITSSVMFIMPAILGPIFVLIGSYLVSNFGSLTANAFYVSTVFVGLICILFSRQRLRRQEAIEQEAEDQKRASERIRN